MKLSTAININDLRVIARRRVPRFVFDYVDGGAEDEVTLNANRESFERLRFRPRTLIDVAQRDVGTTLVGGPAAFPAVAGPIGFLGLSWKDGDLAVAKGAERMGIPYALSTVSMYELEDIARQVETRLWFQCYVFKERDVTDHMIRRAADAGYEALIITSDFPVQGKRERDWRSGLLPSTKFTFRTKLNILRYPRWLWSVGKKRPRFINVERSLGPNRNATEFLPLNMFDPSLDWDDFRRLRDQWKGKLILKGVLRVDDAARAVEYGADGVVLSNHGGRQLDGAATGMSVLPEIAREIKGRASVIVDGGVRRGSDIAKAIASGADAVICGRAVNYGLLAGGADGVVRALEILRDEFDRTLGLNGCRRVSELTADLLASM